MTFRGLSDNDPYVCACGFDARRAEPRPEKVAGCIHWHLAVCAKHDDQEA